MTKYLGDITTYLKKGHTTEDAIKISEYTAYQARSASEDVEKTKEMLKKCDIVFICLYPKATKEFIKNNIEYFKENAIIFLQYSYFLKGSGVFYEKDFEEAFRGVI